MRKIALGSDGRFKMEDGVEVKEDRNPSICSSKNGDLADALSRRSDWLKQGYFDAKVDNEKGLEGDMNDQNQ